MLDNINYPSDLKTLSKEELVELALEIREFLIESVQKTGGHLAPNLGTVELSIVLHYVFDVPNDSIVWDVGHQSYTHKILTGRKDKMSTLRQKDGISGFTKRDESKYDIFGAGHSSTSISAALGIAIANKYNAKDNTAIAVIGDGALTGGMAFEALNHAGDSDANLLIILNDNDMSISKNVGALNKYLTKLLSGKVYSTMKESSLKLLEKIPSVHEFARRSEEHLKGMILPGTLFEELGIDYFGPIDGHDIVTMIKTLTNLKNQSKPRILHIVTKKGQGLLSAEENPSKFHGVSPANDKKDKSLSYSKVFGKWLCAMAKKDEKLIAITPAMGEGSSMQEFEKNYPDRYFDVGIAEQHAITFAAGLATQGLKPVVAIYSTFLQRGYDQLIHDIAIQNLSVVFAIDRAGIVGSDGATHAGVFDLSYLRCIPNITIMAPSDAIETYKMLNTAYKINTPVCVRYPRGISDIKKINDIDEVIPLAKAKIIKNGKKIAILSFGTTLKISKKAANKLNATVVDMRFIKPLDEELILEICQTHKKIITVEDNALKGGAGSGVAEFITQNNIKIKLKIIALADEFGEQGTQSELWDKYGLSVKNIIENSK